MDRIRQFLEDCGILPYLKGRGAEAAPVYLVGGALRDTLSGVAASDFDFIMPVDPTACAKGLAHIFNGTWFMLDASRNQSRVVVFLDNKRIICDFAPFRAPTLEADLRDRDFTMNAMAWPCGAPSISGHILDPLGGMSDLESGILRICSEQAFLEDPLRTLKAIRHATCMHLTIEDNSFTLLRDAVPNIDQIAPERIRAELARILSDDDVSSGLRLLNESGLLLEIFGRPSIQDGVQQAVRQIGLLEKLLNDNEAAMSEPLQAILRKEFEEYLDFASVLKLSIFCRAYRPVALENVLKALRFSNRTIAFVLEMQSCVLTDILARLPDHPVGTRAQARWVSNLGREPIGVLYLLKTEMLSRQMDPATLGTLASSFFEHSDGGKIDDLVDGNWLCTTYQIKSGPVVGRLLKLIEEAELNGEVSTAQEARKWLWDNQKTIDNILLENL